MSSPTPFNPLDMIHLGESVGNALLASTPVPAVETKPFAGAGVYAIYYKGFAAPYGLLGRENVDIEHGLNGWPIYVGKAVPEGGRRGLNVASSTSALSRRLLRDHRRSLSQAVNLDVEDFYFRWLVVEPIWIPLGEAILIERFKPVWNSVLDGFGNHAPGSGRSSGVLSLWDTLHSGRYSVPRGKSEPVYWSDTYAANPMPVGDIARLVVRHLEATLPSYEGGDEEVLF